MHRELQSKRSKTTNNHQPTKKTKLIIMYMAFKIGLNVLCINLYLIREITIAANPLIILIFIYLYIYIVG